jgi:hypothetical protein
MPDFDSSSSPSPTDSSDAIAPDVVDDRPGAVGATETGANGTGTADGGTAESGLRDGGPPDADPSGTDPSGTGPPEGGDPEGPTAEPPTEALGVTIDRVVAWFDDMEVDDPEGSGLERPPGPPGAAAPAATTTANVVAIGLAVVAAAGALVAEGHPTVFPLLDAPLRAGFAFVVTLAASRARRYPLVVFAGLTAFAAQDLVSGVPGWAAFVVAFAAAVLDVHRRWLGAVVGLLATTALLRLPSVGPHGFTALLVAVAVIPVCVSAYRLQPRRIRVRLRRVGYVVGAVVAVPVIGLVVAVAIGAPKVNAGIAEARAGVDSAKLGEDEATTAHLRTAVDELTEADAAFHAWYAAPARLVPLVGYQAVALGQMAETGRDLAVTASDTATGANYRSIGVEGGRIDTDQLAALGTPLRAVQRALSEAKADTDQVDTAWLLPPLHDKYRELVDEVDEAATETATAIDAVTVVPAMLGADGPRRYFVAFTTPAELRGSGGFMGNWAELTADRGQLELTRTGRNTVLQPQPGEPPRTLDAPADYLARYGDRQPEDSVYDIPVSPDFPSVAQAYESVYPVTVGGRTVDGVISIDPYALAAMLKITGPVTVEGLREPLTADNAADVLLRKQYVDFDQTPQRIDFLADASRKTFDAFIHQSSLRPSQLASTLGPMIEQRRLTAASVHPTEQDLIRSLGLDGAFPAHDQGDFFSLVTQNGGSNKIDAYLHREVEYQASYDPSSGEVEATATVTLRNDAPADGLPPAVIANPPSSGQPSGTNWLWFNFYSPHVLTEATLDGAPLVMGTQREFGLYVYHAYVAVPPKGDATVVLQLSGSIPEEGDYRVDWFQQPAVHADRVKVDLRLPEGWTLSTGDGVAADGRAGSTVVESRTDGSVRFATSSTGQGEP